MTFTHRLDHNGLSETKASERNAFERRRQGNAQDLREHCRKLDAAIRPAGERSSQVWRGARPGERG